MTRWTMILTLLALAMSCSEAQFARRESGKDPAASGPGGPGSGPGGGPGGVNPESIGREDGSPGGGPGSGAGGPGGGPGGTPNGPPPVPGGPNKSEDRVIRLSCQQGRNTLDHVEEIAAPRDTRIDAQVVGEFCPPNPSDPVSVLFVFDFSSSMGRHYGEGSNQPLDGNDPLVNGSCGRLRAAQKIVNKLPAHATVGMTAFAGAALPRRTINPEPLSTFRAKMTAENLCLYVAQGPEFWNVPGAISATLEGLVILGSRAPATNYQAAFQASRLALSQVPFGTRKIVHFITDGEPNVANAGGDPVNSGVAAGKSLMGLGNLTLNGVLLGYETATPQDAVLKRVVGLPSRVKTAANADQLADVISQFTPAEINAQSGQATLVAESITNNIGLAGPLTKVSSGVWRYTTNKATLYGRPGQAVNNVITVTATESAQGGGATHSARITIRYTQQ